MFLDFEAFSQKMSPNSPILCADIVNYWWVSSAINLTNLVKVAIEMELFVVDNKIPNRRNLDSEL
jgi:hypothetical protein